MSPDDKTLEQRNEEFAAMGERVYGSGFQAGLKAVENESPEASMQRFARWLNGDAAGADPHRPTGTGEFDDRQQ